MPGDRADPQSPIARLERQAVDKPHHAGHRVRAGGVGDVDAFHGPRRGLQVQDLLQAGQALLGIDGKDLRLHVLVEFAALVERLQHKDLVTEPGRVFEAKLFRSRLHLCSHLAQQGLLLAFQELLQAVDALAVVLLRDPQVAGGRTLADRGQQARTEPPPARVFHGDVQRAGAKLENLLQDLQGARRPRVLVNGPKSRVPRSRGVRVISTRGNSSWVWISK